MTATTDVRELELALKAQIDTMEGISNSWTIEGENVNVPPAQAKAFREALANAEEIRGVLEPLKGYHELKSWAGGMDNPGGVAAAVAAGMQEFTSAELKTLGEMFVESAEFKALAGGKNGLHMQQPFSLEQRDLGGYNERKDVFTANVGTGPITKFGRTQRDAVVPRPQRTDRVRSLFPAATTDSNLIEYFRVIGFGSNRLDHSSGARPVRERAAADGLAAPTGTATDTFGLKPQSKLKFESAQAPVRTIAHYEVAHRNVLADEPQLQATINNELLYGLRLEEDKQILLGDGTGENLLGVLMTPNIQTYTQANNGAATPVPTETKADALRRAATKAVLAYYPPSGFVLHPYDWEDIELTKATGDGQYVMATNVAVGAESRAWRQPVVESPAMPEGTFLTGAWGLGAQLYDREQANIRISDQHADFFVRNAVAILAEMRLALAVKRPESFVKGTFIG